MGRLVGDTNIERIKSVLPFGLVILTILINSTKTGDLPDNDFWVFPVFSLITLCLYTPYFWFRWKSPRLGRLHFRLIFFALLCMLVLTFMREETSLTKAPPLGVVKSGVVAGLGWAWLGLSTAALSFNLMAVPRYILPALSARLTDRDGTPASSSETVAIVDIESTIKGLKTQFDNFYRAVSQERTNLQETFSRMRQEFKSQADVMAQAKRDVEKARTEADLYRRVAALSREDQRVFLDLIARNKRQDYWIGLLVGIVSSVLGAIVIWLLGSLFS